MPALSQVEWDIINARVKTTRERHNLQDASIAFLYLVLEQFFPDRSADFPEMVVDGSNDLGIDAIEILEREDRAHIYLFQSKYRSGIKSTDRTINDAEVLKIIAFLDGLFDQADWLKGSANLQLKESVCRVWDIHRKGKICNYSVIFCTNGKGLSFSAKTMLESSISKFHCVDYEFYGPEQFVRDIGVERKEKEVGYLQVLGKDVIERVDGDIKGMIASVDARSFVDLISTGDRKSLKRHLFDDNLRIFLGANGGFNSNIIKTASSNESHLFWYLNNGITITCNDYKYNKQHINPVITIEDFQIVNGAQTSHSLLEAYHQAPEAMRDVVLMVRVYATSRNDVAQRVAVATNSQARIHARDLRANELVLKKLEAAFLEEGYFFERKRNMHADQDARRRIDAFKLGQILLAFKLSEPDRAKAESDSIFGERFNSIFHENYDIIELCRLFELYRIIEEMRDQYIIDQRDLIGSYPDKQYLVYGHWFVLYTAYLILSKDKMPVPQGKDALELVVRALSLVAKAAGYMKSTAHYQLFRMSKTKARIVAELEGRQMSLFDM